jgi:hypothetical protein
VLGLGLSAGAGRCMTPGGCASRSTMWSRRAAAGSNITWCTSVIPLAYDPGVEQDRFGSTPELRTPAVTSDARQGGDRHQALAWNYTSGISRTSHLRVHSRHSTSCRTLS